MPDSVRISPKSTPPAKGSENDSTGMFYCDRGSCYLSAGSGSRDGGGIFLISMRTADHPGVPRKLLLYSQPI